ncbi:thioesterase family protein [Nocardioides sp. TRM66260-LWL]|uniref:thioesterase family protein n=1 Tax=Nocardioides sp. TRM66260-LWL TaxID=2874478 RepID=UPI001CC60A14|nr:thioesterase family protein [Nocardioides sp. TRM66260-LWL]MBZ5735612.1 thioesterase family protein [Nocardioides sp. TRM66260-LWL]
MPTPSYFVRTGPATLSPTPLVGGAWNPHEQHVAPALGVLAHAVEQDARARRDDVLLLSRATWEILGTLTLEPVEVAVEVRRPGRTIELVDATLSQGGRAAILLRAWLQAPRDAGSVAGGAEEPMAGPAALEPWDPTTDWPGAFITTLAVRRRRLAPGRAQVWVRTDVPLLDEPVSPTARLLGLLDVANGMSVRADPRAVAFPNLDLTAHLHRAPVGDWLGLDSTVTFGATGLGLTRAVLHDVDGPLGSLAQTLTVRPG